jgi:Vitamin K-dependent gamma-carboxylase/Lipase maturation factor
MRTFRSFYFGIDLHALALLRIALGAMLLFDLVKRVPSAGVWFINAGLLPNHRLLWHPSPYQYSFLFSLWTLTQVRVAFAVFAAIYVCFLVGYRTRLFHVLSWLALLSLHTRTTFIANGGDFVFCTILLWTLFMPLGSRWSLDSFRSRSESDEPAQNRAANPFVSLSVLALRTQLCVIYLLNALNKTGQTWKEGSAVHYLLHQARIVTPFGIWLRQHAPTPLLQAMTYGTLVVEYAIPLLIVVPWLAPWPRRLAIALIWGLHTNIALLANLGVFSPIMMVAALCLLGAEDFEWLASRRRTRRTFEGLAEWIRGVTERTRVYVSQRTARRRQVTDFGSRVHVARARVREAVVGVLILCATSQLINENGDLLPRLAHQQPVFVRAIIDYLRLNQGWSMFAPDAPRSDAWIVVDALTESGRHIDPFNVRASEVADPRLRSIPPRLGQNAYFCNYTLRLPDAEELHEPFQDWILGHGRRTRRPEENVIRFDAYVIEQESPPLGQVNPGLAKSHIFLSGSREQ